MFIESISLSHFRNYEHLQLNPAEYRRIALIGPNAQGKSNFLEALYTLAFASSFRTSRPIELIQWQQTHTHLQAVCRHQRGDDFFLGFEVRKNGKRLVNINHTYQKRLIDYIGMLKLVLFSQEDLELIKGQPARRRLFIDLLMVQVRPGYYALLQNYHRILKQRNALLKELNRQRGGQTQSEQLELWDLQLAETAVRIIKQRTQVLQLLMQLVKQTHIAISGMHEELEAEYRRSLTAESTEAIVLELEQRRQQDIFRGQTSVGPHRDDIVFRLQGRELKHVGSQGQIRTAALAMKVAELLFVKQSLGEYPILLLDDVFSELDVRRQQLLIEQIALPDLQTFITTTHLDQTVERLLTEQALILHVKSGQVISA